MAPAAGSRWVRIRESTGCVGARRSPPESKLVLTVKADGDAGPLEAIRTATPASPVPYRSPSGCADGTKQPRLLRCGEADVALVHEPFDHTGPDAETPIAEPRVVALAAAHPSASRNHLTLADLGLHTGALYGFLDEIRQETRDLARLRTLVGPGRVTPLLPASVAARYPPVLASSTVRSPTPHPRFSPSPGPNDPAPRPPHSPHRATPPPTTQRPNSRRVTNAPPNG